MKSPAAAAPSASAKCDVEILGAKEALRAEKLFPATLDPLRYQAVLGDETETAMKARELFRQLATHLPPSFREDLKSFRKRPNDARLKQSIADQISFAFSRVPNQWRERSIGHQLSVLTLCEIDGRTKMDGCWFPGATKHSAYASLDLRVPYTDDQRNGPPARARRRPTRRPTPPWRKA